MIPPSLPILQASEDGSARSPAQRVREAYSQRPSHVGEEEEITTWPPLASGSIGRRSPSHPGNEAAGAGVASAAGAAVSQPLFVPPGSSGGSRRLSATNSFALGSGRRQSEAVQEAVQEALQGGLLLEAPPEDVGDTGGILLHSRGPSPSRTGTPLPTAANDEGAAEDRAPAASKSGWTLMPWPQRAARGKPTAGGLSPTSQARQRGLAVASALASRFDRGLAPDWGLAALVAVGEARLPAMQAQDDSEQLTDGHTVKMFEVRCSPIVAPTRHV